MQYFVENVSAKEFRDVPTMSSKLHVQTDDVHYQNRCNIQNTDSLLRQNRMEPEEDSPHNISIVNAGKTAETRILIEVHQKRLEMTNLSGIQQFARSHEILN